MAEVAFTHPGRLPNAPGSDLRVEPGSAGFRARIRAWWRRTPQPSSADWEEADARLQWASTEILRLTVELAVAMAELDAARREVTILGKVCVRNEERVEAESAHATAKRERAIVEAAALRSVRAGPTE